MIRVYARLALLFALFSVASLMSLGAYTAIHAVAPWIVPMGFHP